MKKIFLDTNILLDVLLERHPFCFPAQKLWTLADQKKIKAAISSVSLSTIFFIIQKSSSKDQAYKAVQTLVDIFKLVATNSRIVSQALKTQFSDFEDGLQYYSALSFKAQALITRDVKGFEKSQIPVMDAITYLAFMEKTSPPTGSRDLF